jgi:hypothetical protein
MKILVKQRDSLMTTIMEKEKNNFNSSNNNACMKKTTSKGNLLGTGEGEHNVGKSKNESLVLKII